DFGLNGTSRSRKSSLQCGTDKSKPIEEASIMYQEVSGRGITAADTTQSEVDAHYDQVKAIFDVLNGKKEADLLLKNLNILDVHSESVYQGSILVYNKRIVALNPDETAIKVRQVFDGEGLYAIP